MNFETWEERQIRLRRAEEALRLETLTEAWQSLERLRTHIAKDHGDWEDAELTQKALAVMRERWPVAYSHLPVVHVEATASLPY